MINLSRMIMGTLAMMGVVAAFPSGAGTPDPHAILADYGKIVSANGIDEAKAVEIGGIQQWITVRGRDRDNPILLVIHGGPAAPDLPNRYLYEPSWADYFTVVQWDQRGGGKTFELNDPDKVAPTMTKERERKWSIVFGGLIHGRKSYDTLENTEKISPDYSETDFKAIDQGSAFTLPKLLPDLMSGDFTKVKKLGCPVLMFAGRYDYTTPSAVVKSWFDKVRAPSKRFVWFENSAHMIYEEEPGRFLVHLVQDALPLAAARRLVLKGTESNVNGLP